MEWGAAVYRGAHCAGRQLVGWPYSHCVDVRDPAARILIGDYLFAIM